VALAQEHLLEALRGVNAPELVLDNIRSHPAIRSLGLALLEQGLLPKLILALMLSPNDLHLADQTFAEVGEVDNTVRGCIVNASLGMDVGNGDNLHFPFSDLVHEDEVYANPPPLVPRFPSRQPSEVVELAGGDSPAKLKRTGRLAFNKDTGASGEQSEDVAARHPELKAFMELDVGAAEEQLEGVEAQYPELEADKGREPGERESQGLEENDKGVREDRLREEAEQQAKQERECQEAEKEWDEREREKRDVAELQLKQGRERDHAERRLSAEEKDKRETEEQQMWEQQEADRRQQHEAEKRLTEEAEKNARQEEERAKSAQREANKRQQLEAERRLGVEAGKRAKVEMENVTAQLERKQEQADKEDSPKPVVVKLEKDEPADLWGHEVYDTDPLGNQDGGKEQAVEDENDREEELEDDALPDFPIPKGYNHHQTRELNFNAMAFYIYDVLHYYAAHSRTSLDTVLDRIIAHRLSNSRSTNPYNTYLAMRREDASEQQRLRALGIPTKGACVIKCYA
jgi:hypothetical protein